MSFEPNWGPTGKLVYERTYSRTKPNGEKETWEETVERVATGNLAFTNGPRDTWDRHTWDEWGELRSMMLNFRIIPAGRHLWATGASGRQFIMNCHVIGFDTDDLSHHHKFAFLRLMEGGGVGSNYSSRFIQRFGLPLRELNVHIVCDPSHPDYADMLSAGLLSSDYSHEWSGAFPVEDSREGWADALGDLIDTFFRPQVRNVNRVYDVSRVRGKGAPLRTFGGTASGPQPFAEMMVSTGEILTDEYRRFQDDPLDGFAYLSPLAVMQIDHEVGKCVVSGGVRRSARMSIVEWDDPYIWDFLECKRDVSMHWTTNVSVGISDAFVIALNDDSDPSHEHASEVYRAVVNGMLSNGEPGFLNLSVANIGEPEEAIASNPCGEIVMSSADACDLGHVNLDAFAPTPDRPYVDWDGLLRAHRIMTRFLVRATYADVTSPEQRAMIDKNRRIGVGHFGVQGFLVKNGIRFSDMGTGMIEGVTFPYALREMERAVYAEAVAFAHQLRIPVPVKWTTIAPTGSIAKLAGRTEGIHPVFAKFFIRRVRFSTVDPDQVAQVAKYASQGYAVQDDPQAANTVVVSFPTEEMLMGEVRALGLDPDYLVESADELSLTALLNAQRVYQGAYATNAVSFTANIPAEAHQNEALSRGEWVMPAPTEARLLSVMAEMRPFLPHLKGTTLMVDGTRPLAPYQRLTPEQWETARPWAVIGDSVDEECANGACPIR
ncbi:ribonucleoside-triphosphate reductase, adenosylcobalamin-dependent [Actinoplanes sp. CA-054009]